jgi:hypothetical protein
MGGIFHPVPASPVDAEITRYSYKPGWRIERLNQHALLLTAKVEDSYEPGRFIKVAHVQPFNEYLAETPEGLRRTIKHLLKTYEEHEFDEWFRYDGKLIDDPHQRIIKHFPS